MDQGTKSYDRCMHLEDGQLVIYLSYYGGADDSSEYTQCATEGGYCECDGTITYGAGVNGQPDFSRATATTQGSSSCTNGQFGRDPLPGTAKACFCGRFNSAFTVTNDVTGRNMSDGQWHYLKFECKTGVNCRTYLDGKRGEDAPADHSRQTGPNTFYFGYSYYANAGLLPAGAYYFKGEMKDIFIESNFYPLTQY